MSTNAALFVENINEIMEIVHALRKIGLVQGKEFDFKYVPATWDNFSKAADKHVVFTFYNEKWATWFILKYSAQAL